MRREQIRMNLYLVRHGKAEQGGDDAKRRLTDKGRESVGRVARRLARAGVQIDRIEHSGLVRAAETAEILAEALGGRVVQSDGLLPDDDVASMAKRLEDGPIDSRMLVGHNPFMERLAAYLLGDPDADIVRFGTSQVALFSDDGGHWSLDWSLSRDLA
jgi:phosphohistidine phosphatase